MPRSNSHASNGPRIAPCPLRTVRMRAHNASSRAVASAPATTSECPLRYLVAECITMSAPRLSGWLKIGVATVESTASTAPAPRAIAATAVMSVMVHNGLAGVSIQTSLVSPAFMAARTAARSVVSTSVTRAP